MSNRQSIGAVVIGRNEGERLKICLTSLRKQLDHIVYVDSGSTDDSIAIATNLAVNVISLGMTKPFTAARARNHGFKELIAAHPQLEYVQFVDGDCQLDADWIALSSEFLAQHAEYAVACGRRRERFPEKSIYNLLCDIEWNTPVGDATACGGDALIRVHAFTQVNGYPDNLIAGEEPEMCFRLREKGWKIYRLDAEMTAHDAAMTTFKQWWQRTKRGGFAYAAVSDLHGNSPEKFWLRETRSLIFWGGLLPVFILFSSLIISPWLLGLIFIYFIQFLKIAFIRPMVPNSRKSSVLYAGFVILGKFPQFLGAIKYMYLRRNNLQATLIEYK